LIRSHVVVGAQLESEDLVALLGPGREHDHRHGAGGGVLLEPPAELPAVDLRQHEVQQHQVRPGFLRLPERVGPVRRHHDVEPLARQRVPDELGDVPLVLGDEHAGRGTAGGALTRSARCHLARVTGHPHLPGESFAQRCCDQMTAK
jgi:hypothetical protein